MIPAAAPLRVRERLRAAPDGARAVVHSGPSAIYVDLDGWCLGLLSSSATGVPCGLWTSLPDLGALGAGPVEVVDGSLVVAGKTVRITRLVDVSAPTPAPGQLRHASGGFAPAIRMTLAEGFDLPDALTPDHVAHLLGRGPGLTPLGDDVLAGWFVARHAAGRPDTTLAGAVRPRLGATTLLSATLLDCAMRGEALPQLATWLADPTPATTEALMAVGATSGTGLLAGARLALAWCATDHRNQDDRPGRVA